jgi:hypothetical protein
MKSDSDLLREYLDKRNTPKTIAALHHDLLDRKKDHNRDTILSNVSTISTEKDGYINKLGVSKMEGINHA